LTGIICLVGPARAPEVVFVPGFMQRGDAWRPAAERLGTRYLSVCLDPRATTFDGRVTEVLAATRTGAALVGYSMGGRLALHAALRDPGRLGALVLVGASAGIEDEEARAARRARDDTLADWMRGRSIEEIVARWERSPPLATQSPALRAAQRPGRVSHEPKELASLLRTAGQGVLPAVWDRLAEIECPTLVLAGERDDAYARAARRMAALLPRGRERMVPGAGHAPQLEAPELVGGLLVDFLDQHLVDRRVVGEDPEAGALRHAEQPARRRR
jgi:2-succinyl-6-hydroxy-2,4-cyclohexadiene-1-carboxylate synthase